MLIDFYYKGCNGDVTTFAEKIDDGFFAKRIVFLPSAKELCLRGNLLQDQTHRRDIKEKNNTGFWHRFVYCRYYGISCYGYMDECKSVNDE